MTIQQYTTKEEILEKAKESIGIPFKDIDKSNKLKEIKGGIGKMIEEDWFGIENNSRPEPDFAEAGVELKVTPYYYNSRGLRAKERLVCNIINYEEENTNDFYKSSYWKKNATTLIMSYHDKIPERNSELKTMNRPKLTNEQKYEMKKLFSIDESILFSIPQCDLPTVINDWRTIATKIKTGKAHELSEKDTMYLSACTKGANKNSKRNQLFGPPAMQRAYSLKVSYMTYILNNYIFGESEDENIIKDINNEKGIVEYIKDAIKPFIGKTQTELKEYFGITKSHKSLNSMLISRILSVGDIENSAEFKKAGIKIKTIRVEASGESISEDMSFPAIKFNELINEEWEESNAKEHLVDNKYMFVIFRKDENYKNAKTKIEKEKCLYLNNVLFWEMPEEDEDEVKKVWKKAQLAVLEGAGLTRVEQKNGSYIVKNTLPKGSESRVAHMRPHTSLSGYTADSPYADQLPNGEYMTKQSFWLNKKYIFEQIKDYIK